MPEAETPRAQPGPGGGGRGAGGARDPLLALEPCGRSGSRVGHATMSHAREHGRSPSSLAHALLIFGSIIQGLKLYNK